MTINDLQMGHRYRIDGDGEVYVHSVQSTTVTVEYVDDESVAFLKSQCRSRKVRLSKNSHAEDVYELVR